MNVQGSADPRFAAVRDCFAGVLDGQRGTGAAFAAWCDGRLVVDLWGGRADPGPGRPWEAGSLVQPYSVSKPFAAVCALRLVETRQLELDAPVQRYWPEFRAPATVRHVLSHQAGVVLLDRPAPTEVFYDWDRLCALLAAQEPCWEPGTAHGESALFYGHLVGELVRRVAGVTLGTMVRREVAGPLAADFYIGVPEAELGRIADHLWTLTPPDVAPDDLSQAQHMELCAYFNPPDFSGAGVVNTRRWRMAELPSTNGHATARGIARIFDALVSADRANGIVNSAALHEATTEQVAGDDMVLGRPSRFGIGFQLTQAERPLGPNPRSYGHFGAGGSLGFCDPDAGLAFGYAINTMGPRWQNPRNGALIEACYDCL